jgi:hydroxyacylglutathione hydrolase
MLELIHFVLGPVQTNTYLIADPNTNEAAVIDPAWDGQVILKAAQERSWHIGHLWYTHAHFDHIGGAAAIANALDPPPLVALHPNDHALWRTGGGGAFFGFDIDPGPEPALDFYQGQILRLGDIEIEVRFTPGHTPGHCILYVPSPRAERLSFDTAQDEGARAEQSIALRPKGVLVDRSLCFTGDLIFAGSVGCTDLPGGDWDALVNSIKTQVFTLPDETWLLSGHGPETTVGCEKKDNPYLGGK